MRYCCFILLLLLHIQGMYAQSSDIGIAVAMPSECQLDNNTKSILKNKLLRIISSQGVAGIECGAIVIVPDVDVANYNTIGGGMRRITSVELEITVSVRNMITNTIFNATQIHVTGEGYSDIEAKRSAINKINVNSSEYAQFVKESKTKIYDYYDANTSVLLSKAKTLASQQLYDEALALLASYPESLPGYAKISDAMVSIFEQYQGQILLSAQAAYSRRDYAEAAELAATISAQSKCAPQAKALLDKINKSEDKLYNDMLAKEREEIQSKERIRLAQIKAIENVATAYFQRQSEYIFFW